MSLETFESHKRSLINKRLEKVKNLSQETARIWSLIGSEYYDFFQRDEQAKHIRLLKKEDVVQFFKHHIDPQSPHRAKLSVHLQAQTSPKSVADSISPEEQKDQLVGTLIKFLATLDINADPEKLKAAYRDTDFSQIQKTDIVGTLKQSLTKEDLISEEQSSVVSDEATKLMDALLPSLGIEVKTQVDGEEATEELPPAPPVKETTYIDDVRKYKSGLQTSAGAQPVTDLTHFEDFESKL